VTPPAGAAERGVAQHDRALARIDLAAVERNSAELKRRLGDAALCAVVKADGYGHGAAWCARAAVAGGATWLAVATADEAAELRRHGLRERLLVMGALNHEELETALRADADVVAWRKQFAEACISRAEALDHPARLHVKLDTGMGRLGTRDVDEALELVALASGDDSLQLAGFMTHFATADELDSDFFDEQLGRFASVSERVKGEHPKCVVHAANSAAVFRSGDAHFDMARCGIAIYGLDPFHEDAAARDLSPALALESYVADVKPAAVGDSAGYGRTWRAERPTHIAVLPIGYGDGYRRGLSNGASVVIRGRRYPLAGTVSMDNITVDVGPEPEVVPGDLATLIGAQGEEHVSAEELAAILTTINYEVTCGIAPRVRRLYHRGGESADRQRE
jgi:alanine racemase